MNQYRELCKKQQQEISALPIRYAFGDKRFREMMTAWDLAPEKDLDKVCKLGHAGGFCRKVDVQLVRDTLDRHTEERKAAIAEDQTGAGFIYQMFLYELNSHEYGYTEDVEETLDALGYTLEQILEDRRLLHGLKMAQEKITGRR